MQPVSPVLPVSPILPDICLFGDKEVVIAKDQPQYIPLPAVVADPYVFTRWRLSWRERLRILFSGDLWLILMTFGKPLQPVRLETQSPYLQATQAYLGEEVTW
jgi:hypothetical protein